MSVNSTQRNPATSPQSALDPAKIQEAAKPVVTLPAASAVDKREAAANDCFVATAKRAFSSGASTALAAPDGALKRSTGGRERATSAELSDFWRGPAKSDSEPPQPQDPRQDSRAAGAMPANSRLVATPNAGLKPPAASSSAPSADALNAIQYSPTANVEASPPPDVTTRTFLPSNYKQGPTDLSWIQFKDTTVPFREGAAETWKNTALGPAFEDNKLRVSKITTSMLEKLAPGDLKTLMGTLKNYSSETKKGNDFFGNDLGGKFDLGTGLALKMLANADMQGLARVIGADPGVLSRDTDLPDRSRLIETAGRALTPNMMGTILQTMKQGGDGKYSAEDQKAIGDLFKSYLKNHTADASNPAELKEVMANFLKDAVTAGLMDNPIDFGMVAGGLIAGLGKQLEDIGASKEFMKSVFLGIVDLLPIKGVAEGTKEVLELLKDGFVKGAELATKEGDGLKVATALLGQLGSQVTQLKGSELPPGWRAFDKAQDQDTRFESRAAAHQMLNDVIKSNELSI